MLSWSSLFRSVGTAFGWSRMCATLVVFAGLVTFGAVSITGAAIATVANPTADQVVTFLADARPVPGLAVRRK